MPCRFSAAKPLPFPLRRFAFALFFAALMLGSALAQDSASTSASTVPNLVKFSGAISGAPAGTTGVIFALYQDQTGGAPLWQEVQNVTVDSNGHYTSLLGSSTAAGIPLDVFSSNEARWLGVQAQGQAEQPRVLLVSVPYALKAADAQTLGGLPPSAFLRADAVTIASPVTTTSYVNTAAVNSAVRQAVVAAISITGTATAGTLPVFADTSGNLKNSVLLQYNSGTTASPVWNMGFGTGTTPPAFNLNFVSQVDPAAIDIDGYGTVGINFIGRRAEGTLAAPTGLLANDNIMTMQGRGYYNAVTSGVQPGFSGSSRAYMKFFAAEPWTDIAQGTYIALATTTAGTAASATERLRIDSLGNVGIGTKTPGGAASTSTPVVLEVNGIVKLTSGSNGGLIFADGSSQTKGVDITKIPELGTTNVFTQGASFGGPVTGSAVSAGNDALYGDARTVAGASGVGGDSDTSFGVFGDSLNPVPGAAGVIGYTQGKFSTVYSEEAGIASAGLWGDTSGSSTVPVAIFGTADAAYAGAFINNSADFPSVFVDNNAGIGLQVQGTTDGLASSTSSGFAVYGSTESGDGVYGISSTNGNGVYGIASSLGEQHAGVLGVGNTTSVTYGTYNIYSGVWGDTGTSSTTVSPAWAIGVLGTADDSHAGVFLNNSASWSTMYIENYGTAGIGNVAKPAGLFATLNASTSTGTCGIGGNGDLTCTGQVKTLATTGGGARTVETYAMQSPENWMEDFGSATLTRGAAVVQIDPAFAETVSETADYHVFITPNGDSMGLYVIRKTASSFEVRESGGGKSSLSFDYRIVAKRRGYEAQRMTDVTERFRAEQQGLNAHLKVHVSSADSHPVPSLLVPKTNATPARSPVPGKQLIATRPLAPVTRP